MNHCASNILQSKEASRLCSCGKHVSGEMDSSQRTCEFSGRRIWGGLSTKAIARRFVAISYAVFVLAGCALNLGGGGSYGNYGGDPKEKTAETFSLAQTVDGVRWFPRHVRFAPDESNLLVSLCHTTRRDFCRIGRYHLASGRWEVLPFEDKSTYTWPLYAPDGKAIYVLRAPCDEQYRCDFGEEKLFRLSVDGQRMEEIAPITATHLNISPDGKRLIYWRIGSYYSIRGRAQTRANIFEMDLETRLERPLLKEDELYTFQDDRSFSFFLKDGESFYFNAAFRDGRNNRDEAKSGWSIAKLKDVPVGAKDVTPASRSRAAASLDATRDDNIAFIGDITRGKKEGDPVAWSIRKPDPDPSLIPGKHQLTDFEAEARRTGGGNALLLLPVGLTTRAVAAFDFLRCEAAAVTPTGSLAACIEDDYFYSRYRRGLELSRHGEQGSRRIDWPRLTLTPGFIDLNNQP